MNRYDTQDSLFDTAWSEAHENQIVVGCGDGSVKLFDISVNEFPVQSWQEHNREVFSVFWNLVAKDTFASSSWDGTIKIVGPSSFSFPQASFTQSSLLTAFLQWSPSRATSILTLPTHSCTYSTAFSPHSPSIISSVSSDSHLRIFDLRTPASASNHLVTSVPIHAARAPMQGHPGPIGSNRGGFAPSEALTHDWNKYRTDVIATAGVDRIIRTFDIRNPAGGPVALLQGHEYAIRKVAWSPHLSDVLLSASYDMTCRVWSDGTAMGMGVGSVGDEMGVMAGMGKELGRMGRHTEFVTGVDWCLFGAEGWCASCGWDERLLVWDVRAIMGK